MNKIKNEDFKYQRLSQDEQKARGILGRLVGVCADFINPTRNGRQYGEQLWENVFNNDIMKEKIANRVCFGELGHPVDREEVDMDKVAICLAEQPVKNDNGQLVAVFDILDTPNGRILKTLCDYGSNIGISSRGSGDLYTDDDGNEAVDPDTYNCECWDAVLIPAVKEARLQYVTESLDTKKYNKTLRQKLTEELDKASEEDKKIMKESLETLDIKLEDKPLTEAVDATDAAMQKEIAEQQRDDQVGVFSQGLKPGTELRTNSGHRIKIRDINVKFVSGKPEVYFKYDFITNRGKQGSGTNDSAGFYNLLSESLDIETMECEPITEDFSITEETLNDKIDDAIADGEVDESAARVRDRSRERVVEECNGESCADKEEDKEEVNEAVDNGTDDLANQLQEALVKASELEKDNLSLQEKLSVCDAKEKKLGEELKKYKDGMAQLSEAAKNVKKLNEQVKQLTEQLNAKDESIKANEKKTSNLTEQLNTKGTKLDESDKKIKKLNEDVNKLNEDLKLSNEKLDKYETTVKKYRGALKESKNIIVELKATSYGLTKDEVLTRLGESYKIKDVDKVCENLSEYKRNMSKLPFKITEDVKVGVKTGKETILGDDRSLVNDDDMVSDYLLQAVKI